jgi:malate dehydrogenase
MNKKIALIGAGKIGGTLAMLCGLRNLGDVVLYDVLEGLPQGKALDLNHMSPVLGLDFHVHGTNKIEDIQDADICIITSGIPRKPGMVRNDLIKTNAEVISKVSKDIKKYAPKSFIIVITNPLDLMACLTQRETGFAPNMVVGLSCMLDIARYDFFLSDKLKVSNQAVSSLILGSHNDEMTIINSCTRCSGVPIDKCLSQQELSEVGNRVRKAGGEIVALLKEGSAFYSPAAATIVMAESYLYDKKQSLVVSAKCNGEYGIRDLYIGVPVILGSNGVEKIIEISISDQEKTELNYSSEELRKTLAIL